MAQVCEICGKGKRAGHNVSYSKRRTKRVFLPNLRLAKILVAGNPSDSKKIKICMKCYSKAKKEGKVAIYQAKAKKEVPEKETKKKTKAKKTVKK